MAYIVPEAGSSLSPFAIEITGTFIGFGLAISFTGIAGAANRLLKEKSLKHYLVKSVYDIVKEGLERNLAVVSSDETWEVAIATGEIHLLDYECRMLFLRFFRTLRIFRHFVDGYERLFHSDDEKAKLDYKLEIDGYKVNVMAKGILILEKYSQFLENTEQNELPSFRKSIEELIQKVYGPTIRIDIESYSSV